MTATAADLQVEFRRLRDEDRETGQKRMATLAAYNAWFKQSCAEGNPPDALRSNAGTEPERFFARTIPGVDGHTYWNGGSWRFRLDSGGERHPRWWWYERVNGPQGRGRLGAVCGERNCVTPEHQRFIPWSELRRRFSDEQLLGVVQAIALRLKHTPTAVEYHSFKRSPSREIISVRFGGWENAMRAAGLDPSPDSIHKRNDEDCVAGLQHLARHLRLLPGRQQHRRNRAGAVLHQSQGLQRRLP